MFLLEEGDKIPDSFVPSSDFPIAIGGDLSQTTLIDAYNKGVFPWYGEGDAIMWWTLDPRMILYPQKIRVSKSLRATLRKSIYEVRINTNFDKVIEYCSKVKRIGQDGTWIVEDMKKAYKRLNRLGYAISFETYFENNLVGGLYGVRTEKYFSGESMFSLKTDASKVALIELCKFCIKNNIGFIDCQQPTSHLASMGGVEVSGEEFRRMIF